MVRSLFAALAVFAAGCHRMNASVFDESVGLNGGFEVVQQGLPVNWLVYAPGTLPAGDYDLVIDTLDYKEGRQSLRFDVRACSPNGGWYSPGFSRELKATPGTTYTVGFWVKNDGAEYLVRIGGVSATEGAYETIVRSRASLSAWTHHEHRYTVPSGFDRIRLEVNIVGPGVFRIDDISITE
jgi:hypothetical protein